MSKPSKTSPKFASKARERAFWETHDSSESLDWYVPYRSLIKVWLQEKLHGH